MGRTHKPKQQKRIKASRSKLTVRRKHTARCPVFDARVNLIHLDFNIQCKYNWKRREEEMIMVVGGAGECRNRMDNYKGAAPHPDKLSMIPFNGTGLAPPLASSSSPPPPLRVWGPFIAAVPHSPRFLHKNYLKPPKDGTHKNCKKYCLGWWFESICEISTIDETFPKMFDRPKHKVALLVEYLNKKHWFTAIQLNCV